MTNDQGPVRTSRPPQTINLTGALFPVSKGGPVHIKMEGAPSFYLPCFTTEEKLRAFLTQGGAMGNVEAIMVVQDANAFYRSVPREVQVILDPCYTPEGRVRYLLCLRN